MPVITCIQDLKDLHRKRTPKMFYDYCESGSYTEQTFRENTSDFADIRLRQKVAVDMSGRTTESTMLGRKVAMPLGLCPVGMTGMQRADGEIKAARAAAKFGVPYTLSTMSICSIEDVHAASPEPFWFQLYVMTDEDFVDNLLERAKKANCSALVVTLDLQILGQRHKDLKNGLSAPPKLTLPNIVNMMTKVQWGLEMLGTPRRTFGNIVGHAKSVTDTSSLSTWTTEQFDPRLDWAKIARIRDNWGGKLILKGINDPDDARMAADFGADAIIVSNHGGRQLDGALPTIRMLPKILEAVGGERGKRSTEVYIDSGIRQGQDILKALALGADAAMIGRAYIHGLGAMGEAGVSKALQILRAELDTSMALCGERDVNRLRRENLLVPKGFFDSYVQP